MSDWIKMHGSLSEDPRVASMASRLGAGVHSVSAGLMRVWARFGRIDHGGDNDPASGQVDIVAGYPGFAEAMRLAGFMK